MFADRNLTFSSNCNDSRLIGYDFLRVFSALLVVFIHTAANFTCGTGIGSLFRNQLLTFSNIAVPLFFMISGALLLDVSSPVLLRNLFYKRIPGILIPFILWSAVYICLRIANGTERLSLSAFISVWHEPAYYQFWFVYTLLAIYLLLPFLQLLALKLTKTQYRYLLLLWLVTNAVVYQLRYFGAVWTVCGHFDLVFINGFLGYFLLGFYIKKFPADSRIYLFAALVGLVSGIGISLFCWSKGHYWNEYVSLPSALFCFGLFGLVSSHEAFFHQNIRLAKLTRKISGLTYGIYLIHLLPITALKFAGFMKQDNFATMSVMSLTSFFLSVAACLLLSLVKPFKKLLLGIK